MKMPFRQQVSNFDCVPTTLINAMTYLFNSRDIPPFVVHRIYKDCLDVESYRGTSSCAMKGLGFWFNHYREKRFKRFAIESKFLDGKQVHLSKNSKIRRCLNSNGAALLCVHSGLKSWHYILGFKLKGEWLHCYDPSPRTNRFIKNDAVQFIKPTGRQEPNLIIRCDWLDRNLDNATHPDDYKYVFGNNDNRECLLLNKIQI